MDLGGLIGRRLRAALRDGGRRGPTNVAAAVNVDRSGHVTAVSSDEAVTIIQRDGEVEVIRHDRPAGGPEADPGAGGPGPG